MLCYSWLFNTGSAGAERAIAYVFPILQDQDTLIEQSLSCCRAYTFTMLSLVY